MSRKYTLLYHFTCDHGRDGIAQTGILLPRIHPFMPHLGPLLWLTDVAVPTPEAVGLTSRSLTCDRLSYRYCVRTSAALPWSQIRARANADVVATLESYGHPEHWWVARRPLTASEFSFDPTWKHTATQQARLESETSV